MSNTPLYGYITIFMNLSADGHLACFYFLDLLNNAAMNICTQVFVYIFWILLGTSLEM